VSHKSVNNVQTTAINVLLKSSGVSVPYLSNTYVVILTTALPTIQLFSYDTDIFIN